MSLYDIPFDAMDGTTHTLREHADDVVLVVNVASRCGSRRSTRRSRRCRRSTATAGSP